MNEYRRMVESLRAVVIHLEDRLPVLDVEVTWDYLDHNEPELALDQICYRLDEDDIAIPQWVYDKLAAAGQTMRMKDDLWRDLRVDS